MEAQWAPRGDRCIEILAGFIDDLITIAERCDSIDDGRLCELWEAHDGDGPDALAAPLEDFGGPSAGGDLVTDLRSLLAALHILGLVPLADGGGKL